MGNEVTRGMKLQIAQAGERLLSEKNRKKLTVTDIVEECHITRQTFYYHFKDIPDMLMWNLRRKYRELSKELARKRNFEEIVQCCLEMMVKNRQYGENILMSNYGEEMVNLITSEIRKVFFAVSEQNNFFPGYTLAEKKMIVTCYAYAFGAVMKDWDELGIEDAKTAAKIFIQVASGEVRFSSDGRTIRENCLGKIGKENEKESKQESEN